MLNTLREIREALDKAESALLALNSMDGDLQLELLAASKKAASLIAALESEELVERVACAIFEERTLNPWDEEHENLGKHNTRLEAKAAIKALTGEATESETDLSRCPKCGGPADNGIDRCLPPSPYFCTKCTGEAGEV